MSSTFFSDSYPYSNLHELNLDWILSKINEFTSTLESWSELAQELEKGLADIDDIKSDIEDIQNAISDLADIRSAIYTNSTNIADLIERVATLEDYDWQSYIDAQIELIIVQLKNYYGLFSSLLNEHILDCDIKIQSLSDKLDSYYTELLKRIEELTPTDVYNRVAGYRMSLDDNNFNIYEDLRYLGLTNAELSSYGVNNNNVASLCHNNRDYALFAKKRFKRHYLFSPLTGKRVSHSNAISQVIAFITNGSDNDSLDSYMSDNNLTNNDISTVFASNVERYTISV